MPSLSKVRLAGRCDCSTNWMISAFSDAEYLMRRPPHLRSCFFFMITDLPGSPAGFAVQTMSLQYKKPVLLVASTSSDITGPKCTPYSAMWGVDTYTLSNILGSYLTSTGLDTWFFIALDGAVGRTFVSEG